MTDAQLMRKLKNGDCAALMLLMDRYTSYISKVIFMVGRSCFTDEDIEEMTADCFIKVWKMSSSFEMKEESLKSYLATMARNIAKNKLKASKIECLSLEEDCIFTSEDLEDTALMKDTVCMINNCISCFEQPDKDIFLLRFFYLFKIREIAQQLSLNPKTVESKLHRGKLKLRKILEERGETL